jgi:hypothetical protein
MEGDFCIRLQIYRAVRCVHVQARRDIILPYPEGFPSLTAGLDRLDLELPT